METTERPDQPESDEPERPWAQGLGLLVLGLAISAIVNGFALQGEPGPVARTLAAIGYAAGVVIAGLGIHRLLWFRPSRRSRGTQLLVTALVTPLAFAGGALFFTLLFTILQLRFRSL
jgi:hypothetical protein